MAVVRVGPYEFPTKKAAEDVIKGIIQKYPLAMPLVGYNHEIADGLFRMHAAFEKKSAGREVSHYIVLKNGPQVTNRGFWAVFEDGSREVFSYMEALTPSPAHRKVHRAMRDEAQPQVSAFFYNMGGIGGVHEVDHDTPTFEEMAEDFMLIFGSWDHPRLTTQKKAGTIHTMEFSDPKVGAAWRNYHDNKKNLQLLTKDEHKRVTKERKAK